MSWRAARDKCGAAAGTMIRQEKSDSEHDKAQSLEK